MKLSKFKQDVSSAEQGQWVDIGDNAAVKVRRNGSKAYTECVKQLLKPYPANTRKNLADSVWEEILLKATAESLIADWRGIEDESGAEISFSAAKAYELFKDPAYRDFYELVTSLASEAETFRQTEIETTQGE